MSTKNEKDPGGKEMKDVWLEDPNMPQSEIDEINTALKQAAEKDPRWGKLIWNKKPQD